MLPALPTGMQCTVGASPSASQISNAAVFWPSMRNGLIELTTVDAAALAELADEGQRLVEAPAHRHDLRAVDQRLGELAERDLTRRGCTTAASSPARAAYAAADAEVFPVDAQTTDLGALARPPSRSPRSCRGP